LPRRLQLQQRPQHPMADGRGAARDERPGRAAGRPSSPHGGASRRMNPEPSPARPRLIPYGRQCIDEDDVAAVVEVLRSDWLTTGPAVDRFEQAVAAFTGARFAVAVSSGTAGLHAAMHALGIGP